MNNNNKTIVTIALVALIALVATSYTHGMASAYLSQDDHYYNQGYYDAKTDCYQLNTCWTYFTSDAFNLEHSQHYRDGYTSIVDFYYHKNYAYCDHAVYDCSGANDYDHDIHPAQTTSVGYGYGGDNNDNQAYSNDGNTNYQQSTADQHTQQNTVNTLHSSCVINCVIQTSQDPSSSENNGN